MANRRHGDRDSGATTLELSGGDGVHMLHSPGPVPAQLTQMAEVLRGAQVERPKEATLLVVAGLDDIDTFLERVAPMMEECRASGVGTLRLVMSGAAADLTDRPAPARRICEDWGLDVVAPGGFAVVVPDGTLFAPDLADSSGGWWLFSPGLVPRRLGARHPEPGWQGALERVASDIADGYLVEPVPAGVLIRPVGARVEDVDAVRYAVPVDPGGPMLLVGTPDTAPVSAEALVSVIAALPAQIRGAVRLVPADGRDLLTTGQEVTDLLELEVQVASGLPVLLESDDPQHMSRRVVLVDADGNPTWYPYVEAVTCLPSDGAEARAPRIDTWHPPVPGLSAGSEPGALLVDMRWQMTVTRAGLWIGPRGRRCAEAAERPVDTSVVAIDLGLPGKPMDDSLWPVLEQLFATMAEEVRDRAMIQLQGTCSGEGMKTLRRLTVRYGLALAPKGWRGADTGSAAPVAARDTPTTAPPSVPAPPPAARPVAVSRTSAPAATESASDVPAPSSAPAPETTAAPAGVPAREPAGVSAPGSADVPAAVAVPTTAPVPPTRLSSTETESGPGGPVGDSPATGVLSETGLPAVASAAGSGATVRAPRSEPTAPTRGPLAEQRPALRPDGVPEAPVTGPDPVAPPAFEAPARPDSGTPWVLPAEERSTPRVPEPAEARSPSPAPPEQVATTQSGSGPSPSGAEMPGTPSAQVPPQPHSSQSQSHSTQPHSTETTKETVAGAGATGQAGQWAEGSLRQVTSRPFAPSHHSTPAQRSMIRTQLGTSWDHHAGAVTRALDPDAGPAQRRRAGSGSGRPGRRTRLRHCRGRAVGTSRGPGVLRRGPRRPPALPRLPRLGAAQAAVLPRSRRTARRSLHRGGQVAAPRPGVGRRPAGRRVRAGQGLPRRPRGPLPDLVDDGPPPAVAAGRLRDRTRAGGSALRARRAAAPPGGPYEGRRHRRPAA